MYCKHFIWIKKRKKSMLSKVSENSQEIILLGDLNVNFLKQGNKDFKAVLADFGRKKMIEKPTRVAETSETLIDVILTNNPTNIKRTEVIPTSIGDHDMVGCVRKLNRSGFKARKIICRDYKNYRPEDMNKDLEAIDWSPFYICQNVNEAWSLMKNVLVKIFEHHAPKICKNVRGRPAPWLNTDVKKLMNDRENLSANREERKRKWTFLSISVKEMRSTL